MTFIGFEREDEAIEWAKARIGLNGPSGFCRAISTVDASDDLAIVVVFSNFTSRNVDIHIASIDRLPGKAFIEIFNNAFDYIFNKLGAARATGLVKAADVTARRFNEHLGFKLEGILRDAFEDDDLCVYGFLRKDFEEHRWHYGR